MRLTREPGGEVGHFFNFRTRDVLVSCVFVTVASAGEIIRHYGRKHILYSELALRFVSNVFILRHVHIETPVAVCWKEQRPVFYDVSTWVVIISALLNLFMLSLNRMHKCFFMTFPSNHSSSPTFCNLPISLFGPASPISLILSRRTVSASPSPLWMKMMRVVVF